jgi:biopolymer transport protein ExbD
MRIRHAKPSDQKIQLQMTPMIDIVFQLLVFFIMSFRIVAQEGDFNIKMPLASRQTGLPDDSPLLSLHVRLLADDTGRLRPRGGIIVNNDVRFNSMEELHNYIIGIVGGDEPSARADTEVELDCDFTLHYEHVIEAITAVSGYVDRSTGRVERLIEKVKFTPPPDDASGR